MKIFMANQSIQTFLIAMTTLLCCVQMILSSPAPYQSTDQYSWLCPRVYCTPLPHGCDMSEYLILQYTYRIRERVINVRCQSCSYCLDLPEELFRHRRSTQRRASRSTPPGDTLSTPRRTRRSLYELLGWTIGSQDSQNQECSNVVCPPLPVPCEDIRETDVIVRGRICRECPACYDDTLLKHHPTI